MFFMTLLLILSFIFFFYALGVRYGNPYKLYFLFGKKGSGKSLYMVKKMLYYKKKGWNIYTDMPVNIDGVYLINQSDLAEFTPKRNSAVFLDEVGITMSNRDYKTMPKGKIEWFKLQRKYRCVVYMNSQSYDIDKKIRELVDGMFLFNQLFNCIAIVRPIHRSIVLTDPSSEAESRIADKLTFGNLFSWQFYWMPKYYKYFNSYDAPKRDIIPSTLIEYNEIKSKNPKSILKGLVKK